MMKEVQSDEDRAASRARYLSWYARAMSDPVKREKLLRERREYKAKKRGCDLASETEPVGNGQAETVVSLKETVVSRAALLAAFDEPLPLVDHPFVKEVMERLPCTLVKELEPTKPKLDNSANKLPRLPGETTEQLSLRRNQAWYEANKAFLERVK